MMASTFADSVSRTLRPLSDNPSRKPLRLRAGTATIASANSYLTRKIIIIDRDLANIPVGGRFTSDDPAAFLRALQVGLGIRVSVSDTSFLLTREKN